MSSVFGALIREALYPYPDGLAIVSEVGPRRESEWSPGPTWRSGQ
ncbi:MAG TPA: hypothetical protein VNV62_21905 [Trebonia sp.]|jgi:hypothetical protein|nr:hypothetical protein [Trebonia sp.]